MEQISYDMLFRWSIGLPKDDTAWDQSTFNKIRDSQLALEVHGADPTRRSRWRIRTATIHMEAGSHSQIDFPWDL
ncbi:transposase [Ralstonia sp. 1138]|uniref:transposase n=1 Tax=Ralstonia sp. 1138 TaxID=3156423 RepID=UPI0033920A27